MDATERLRRRLLGQGISPRVVAAMLRVPRDRFVSGEARYQAWEDHAMSIGAGQTISQPTVVAIMTEAADVRPGDRVLDVGTGSGYQAAVLVSCGAQVVGVERIPQLAARARATLADLGMPVPVECADGSAGLPDRAPFDAIVVAAATPRIPPELLRQLRTPGQGHRGGRLVIPLGQNPPVPGGQQLMLVERGAEGYTHRRLLDVVFVPLVWDGG